MLESYSFLNFLLTGTTRDPSCVGTTTAGAAFPSFVLIATCAGCGPVAKSCATPSWIVGSWLSGTALLDALDRDPDPDRRRLIGLRSPFSLCCCCACGCCSDSLPLATGWSWSWGGAGFDIRLRRIDDCWRSPIGRKRTDRARLGGGCCECPWSVVGGPSLSGVIPGAGCDGLMDRVEDALSEFVLLRSALSALPAPAEEPATPALK